MELVSVAGSIEVLREYASVPIVYEVRSRVRLPIPPAGHSALAEEPVAPPYVKDYDAISGNSPASWPQRWDVTRWRVFLIRSPGQCQGGAVLIPSHAEPLDPAALPDTATLWDIRIHPAARRRGLGASLFRAAADWAYTHGHATLTAETQDINVPACRFYAAQGCALSSAVPHAYADFPDEIRFVWRKPLGHD